VREPSFGQGGTWGTPLHAVILVANWQRTNVHFMPPRNLDKVRVMNALLAHGANPNAAMSKEPPKWRSGYYDNPMPGATPFALAASYGDVPLMRILLAHGANAHTKTKNNTTTLMLAAGLTYIQAQSRDAPGDHLEAVKMLLDLGEDVNAVNDQGQTALHSTGYSGWNGIVELLVSKGAKLDVKDKKGRSPLSIADGVYVGSSIYGQPKTAALLRQLGAPEP
jgi:ankyrin repeat protein